MQILNMTLCQDHIPIPLKFSEDYGRYRHSSDIRLRLDFFFLEVCKLGTFLTFAPTMACSEKSALMALQPILFQPKSKTTQNCLPCGKPTGLANGIYQCFRTEKSSTAGKFGNVETNHWS